MATAAVVLPMACAAALVWRHRSGRDAFYAALAAQPAPGAVELGSGGMLATAESLAGAFAAQRLIRVDDFLVPALLARIRDEALAARAGVERSFIPLHKQGGTLSYEQLLRCAPHAVSFYRARAVQDWISAVTGTRVHATPLRDQSSLSVLRYDRVGDHINWHYDHNFYRGRHFTVLLVLVNRAAAGGVSHSQLERQLEDGSVRTVEMLENTLVVFEGACVRHRATPTAAGDLRVILSMTYCEDSRIRWGAELARRVKDTAYYGIRALWD